MAYCFDDGPIEIWKFGDPFPFDLQVAIEDGDTILAHNAAFELAVWNTVCTKKYGWPELPIKNTFCNMVMGYGMGLPGKLEKLSPALGLKAEKDMKGGRIMLQLSQPRKVNEGQCKICGGSGTEDLYHTCEACNGSGDEIIFWEYKDAPEKFEAMYSYCKQDVEVERQAEKRMLMLTPKERKLWLLDQVINERGILIDINSVNKAIEIINFEKQRLNDEMRVVTNNAVATYNSLADLKNWLEIICDVKLPEGLAKGDVSNILRRKDLNPKARQALLIRQEASKSSTAKLNAMILQASQKDFRIRRAFQYYGAYSTGRWAGRGIQFQNLPRQYLKFENILDIIDILNSSKTVAQKRDHIDMMYGQPTNCISECIRSFIIAAPGHRFIDCDWNSIEARMLAWLAGEESVLNIFRTHGKIYEHAASKVYNVDIGKVTKDQRQIGKVAVLALGYGGGKSAFQSMATVYGVKIPDKQAEEIKSSWRAGHTNIVRYWADLENAAMDAVRFPGRVFEAGAKGRQVKYKVVGSFLWCQLPSGRAISYPYPKLEMVTTPWGAEKEGVTYMAEDANTRKWERQKTYGGFFAENITQACSRDILAEALFRLEDKGYKTVIHVHDEIVCEVPTNFGSVEEMAKIMCEIPSWATGLPLAAEGWEGTRFRKD